MNSFEWKNVMLLQIRFNALLVGAGDLDREPAALVN
jgi:hypothetical protein